jgi:hypothetical protein
MDLAVLPRAASSFVAFALRKIISLAGSILDSVIFFVAARSSFLKSASKPPRRETEVSGLRPSFSPRDLGWRILWHHFSLDRGEKDFYALAPVGRAEEEFGSFEESFAGELAIPDLGFDGGFVSHELTPPPRVFSYRYDSTRFVPRRVASL